MLGALWLFCGMCIVIAFLSGIGVILCWRKMKKKRYKCLALIIYSILLLILSPFIILFMELAGFQDHFFRDRYSKHKLTEIFKIKEEIKYKSDTEKKYFVISNPPNDTSLIKKRIRGYDIIDTSLIKKIVEGYDITGKYEYFVISNPPKDASLIRKMVEKYNFQTIPTDTLEKYKDYEREFYQETECLTRNFEEGKPYPAKPWWAGYNCPIKYLMPRIMQELRYHNKEKIIHTKIL